MKYAICKDVIAVKGGGWVVAPWRNAGATFFDTINEVPDDHILITLHYPPWRSPYKEWIAKGNNYIEIDYGYWGVNNPRRNTRRVTYNGSHNLKFNKVPYSRLDTLNPEIKDWKTTRGDYLLLVEPHPEMIYQRTGTLFKDWKIDFLLNLKQYWDGPIKWRRKAGGKDPNRWPSFLRDLSECHAVLGERTMACVEAVMLGYPAYTTDYSLVSMLMGTDLNAINNPVFFDRTTWLEHVAWSQFSPDEFSNGAIVAEMVEQYQILTNE